jgi:hypothetical protein
LNDDPSVSEDYLGLEDYLGGGGAPSEREPTRQREILERWCRSGRLVGDEARQPIPARRAGARRKRRALLVAFI